MKHLEFFKKFLSRRILVMIAFGYVVPMALHQAGMSDNIVLASMALGATYMGQRAMRG
jgi:hypothetical protein